jgi:hypothetical protein
VVSGGEDGDEGVGNVRVVVKIVVDHGEERR